MIGRLKYWSSVILTLLILHETEVDAINHDTINPVDVDLEEWPQLEARVAIPTDNEPACERRSIYTCEEPLDLVPATILKSCNYRNVRFHEQVFRWVAGQGCLFFTPDFLYVDGVNKINMTARCFYENLLAPCLEIPKEDGTCGCYPFDPGLEEVANAVREALIPAAHGRWERCFYAARECCSHYMLSNNSGTDPDKCEATFDGWTCWQEAMAGTTESAVCSEFAYSNSGPSCHHFSSKQCFDNGTWELQTDYSTCSITPRLLSRYRYYIAVLSFSIVSCLPAVFIFFFYKRLRITRVILHRNLLISIIVRNILVIISRNEVYIDELTNTGETVMSTHGIACRILAVAERVAGNAVFICMLIEGVFLHRLIVAVFRQKVSIKWLYAIGAVIAITPAVAWAAVMAVYNDHSCWLVFTVEHIQWILDAPRLLILIINTILFIDVLRVLLTKIRNSENANQLSTAKATLFLMPVFGTQFLLTAIRPNTTNCTGEQIYYYVSYTVEGLQGFVVALLYCYINKEVHTLIKATYKRTESAVVSRIRGDSSYPRLSSGPNSDRRITFSTGLPSYNECIKDNDNNVKPKLHEAEIMSIQTSEKLAEILDPVYETIHSGIANECYDSLERSDADNDFATTPNRNSKVYDCYNLNNESSSSVDGQDWIKCVSSPSSSIYDNSLNDYETKYLERKFHNHPQPQEVSEGCSKRNSKYHTNDCILENNGDVKEENDKDVSQEQHNDNEDMLNEIIHYIETNDFNRNHLNADLLCPNRKDKEKIIFVEE